MSLVLWVVQGLLALLFLALGGMKLALPAAEMAAQMPVPVPLVRFIGVAEVLGAFGLVLPGLLRARTVLTPLAAAGLAIITAGATVVHLAQGDGVLMALFPFVVMLLSLFVAVGRWQRASAERTGHAASSQTGVSHAR